MNTIWRVGPEIGIYIYRKGTDNASWKSAGWWMRLFRYYLAVNRDGETGRGVTLTRQHVKGGTGPLPKSNPIPLALFLPPSLLFQSIRSIFRYFPSSFPRRSLPFLFNPNSWPEVRSGGVRLTNSDRSPLHQKINCDRSDGSVPIVISLPAIIRLLIFVAREM